MVAQTPITTEDINPEEVTHLLVFHRELNPKFWDTRGGMHHDVRLSLLKTAHAFYDFLEIPNLKIVDIVVVGSNAAYNYTELSDLDVHFIVDISKIDCSGVMENFFSTKKTLWNTIHDISAKGQPVEMYVQDTNAVLESNGVFSLLKNKWIDAPKAEKPSWDDTAVVAKTAACAEEIEALLANEPQELQIEELLYRIHNMRRAGLMAGGEFSTENLAYKSLRNLGYLSRLYNLKVRLHDRSLSQF